MTRMAAVSLIALLGCAAANGQCAVTKLQASPVKGGAKFGIDCDVHGGRVLVGAPYSMSERAFVFQQVGGAWDSVAIEDPTPAELESFGYSVGLDGDVAAVGTYGNAIVEVFEASSSSWLHTATLDARDGQPEGHISECTVEVRGTTVAVGALEDYNENGGQAGAVYLYERDPNGVWARTARVIAEDGNGNDHFGRALSLEGDRLAVGAADASPGTLASGLAYIFDRDELGQWTQSARLEPPAPLWTGRFGASIALSGDRVIVGAIYYDGVVDNTGLAYIFERDAGGNWPLVATLWAADGTSSDEFGRSIALQGDLAIIGARRTDNLPIGASIGAVYIFQRQSSGVWQQIAKLIAPDGQPNDEFGYSLALDGTTLVVGAWQDDDGANNAGSAYIFSVSPDNNGNGVMDVCECPGDLDADNDVDISDLATQLSNYGAASGATPAEGDLDLDQDIDITDLSLLLAVFGVVCG